MARTRGTAMIQLVKTLRANRERARAFLPESLWSYLTVEIARSQWYPEEDYLALLTAMAKLWPEPDVWERLGNLAAHHDFSTGVYRAMVVKRGGLMEALRGLDAVFHMYHDTGRTVLAADGPRATIEIHDYATVDANHCRFMVAFGAGYLELALGRAVSVRETQCRSRGAQFCRWELSIAAGSSPVDSVDS
jgi:hypothetical protein